MLCYYTSMKPRRAQTPIMIRSDKAAELLARHVRPGRSQAKIIEEALEQLPVPGKQLSPAEALRIKIEAVLDRVDRAAVPKMSEFDAAEYDERGDPQ